MRRSAFSTKFPPKPTRKDASPKLRVTTTTTGHPGSKGRETYTYTPEGRLSSLLSKVFLFLFQRPESIQRKQILLHGRPADATPTTTVTRPPTTRTTSPGSIRSRPMSATPPLCQRPEQPRFLHVCNGRSHLIRKHFQRYFSLLRLTRNYGDCLPEITTAADEDDEVGVDEGAYPHQMSRYTNPTPLRDPPAERTNT